MYLEIEDRDLDLDQPPQPDFPDTSHSSEGPVYQWRLIIENAFEPVPVDALHDCSEYSNVHGASL